MLKRNLIYICLLFNSFVFANENFTIIGNFKGIGNNSNVTLLAYNYGDFPISQCFINSNTCELVLPNTTKNGVYKIIINQLLQSKCSNLSYTFDLIVDSTEKKIEFLFDPTQSHFPKIIESKINLNLYNFLILESYRLKTIDELSSSKWKTKTNNNLLKDEIYDLNIAKLQFISDDFNRWSTMMVKNSIYDFELENTPQSEYWKPFDTANPQLINSPIYQNLILKYIITYYKNASVENYKKGYEEVIQQFSSNPDTKKWVVKYVIVGLKELGNEELINYFTKKYGYK